MALMEISHGPELRGIWWYYGVWTYNMSQVIYVLDDNIMSNLERYVTKRLDNLSQIYF